MIAEVANRPSLSRISAAFDPQVDRLGDVAQLGERLNRTQEADGSIPFISTKFFGNLFWYSLERALQGTIGPI